jgi:hypothetical protein
MRSSIHGTTVHVHGGNHPRSAAWVARTVPDDCDSIPALTMRVHAHAFVATIERCAQCAKDIAVAHT